VSEQLERRSLLLRYWVDTLSFQDKARIETFKSWIESLVYFDFKTLMALNEKELRSLQEQKQIFLNEIGFDENVLRNIYRNCIDFCVRFVTQTTDEGRQFVCEDMVYCFYLDNRNFTIAGLETALDNFILEKKNKQK